VTSPSRIASIPPTRDPSGEGSGPDPGHATAPRRRRRRGWLILAVLVAAVVVLAAARGYDEHRANRAWHEAQAALARHDLATAAAALDRYTELRPHDPDGWFLAARTARRQEQYIDAGRYLSRCQQLGGATDSTRLEWDLLHVQQGQLGVIDTRLRATIGPEHPEAAQVLEALARGYLEAERFPDAQQACDMWRKLQPDHPRPWQWSGWIAERHGQRGKAAEEYQRAVDLVPHDRAARVALARVLLSQRQPVPAAEHFEQVLAWNPDDVEAQLGLAGCRIEQGRTGEAVPLLDRVLSRHPNLFTALYLRGKAAMEQGDPVGAEHWLRQAVLADPYEVEALHQLVLSLRAQRKDAEADPLARRTDELQADLTRLEQVTLTLTARPADPAPAYEAGVISLRIGRTREGVNLLLEALRRDARHRPSHAALADHYRNAGDPARAAFHQRLADQP
jgi:tetratricopeptide (TPR) repeat protein